MSSSEVHIGEVFRVLQVQVRVGKFVVEGFQLLGMACLLVRARHYGGKLAVFCVQHSSVTCSVT